MRGNTDGWDPWVYAREVHPRLQIVEMDLPGRLQGCVDHVRRIIWLARDMSEVQRRCTLAYELGAYEQGPTPEDPCLAAARRQSAADLAARWLISTEDLMDGFFAGLTLPEIASWLRVDTATLRARLRGMTDDEQDGVMDAIARRWTAAA